MALVLVLDQLNQARPRRLARMNPLQRLNACLLVRADDVSALFIKLLGLVIGRA